MNRLNKLFFIIFLLLSCSKESVKYTLNIKINPTDGGFVNISNGEFSSGEQISIKATASESYTFENWSGDEIGSSPIISVTMDGNKTLTANFRLDPFYLDNNGITIKARDWVTAGTKGILNGVEYTAVDKEMLIKLSQDRKDLSKVVTTLITDMSKLFYPPVDSNFDGTLNYYDSFYHDFNDDIKSWDLSNVTEMSFMFYSARNFNQDIGLWDVSNVTNMESLFVFAQSFNINISEWNVSNVTNMNSLFYNSTSFNQNLTKWCVNKIVNEPFEFSLGSPLKNENKPLWGNQCN